MFPAKWCTAVRSTTFRLLLLALAACGFTQAAQQPPALEYLRVEVISRRPHDTSAFTQGLLLHEGLFYESAGLNRQYGGQSSLRQVDPDTGEVLRLLYVPDKYFAEGLALVDDRLIQLTWRDEFAFVYDLESFRVIDLFSYAGEGWGLCFDGEQLVMSDGSDTLFFRDPDTFELTGQVQITLEGDPITQLNELECVGESVYANVWQTDMILRIDQESGVVTGVIDAAGLLAVDERPLDSGGVLNGIAYDPEQDVFFITGKLWPWLFEVRFVPQEASG